LVEAFLRQSPSHKSPAKVGSEQKPFLTLLQNVLDTVTKATNVVSTRGEQTACEVLLRDLHHICQGHLVPHRFSSPIAQVSLDGSTPHTVSTLSSHNTAPQSAQSSNSVQSDQSVQSVPSAQSAPRDPYTSTPSQGSSLSAALHGAESSGSGQRLVQANRRNTQERCMSHTTPNVPELTHTQHSLAIIPEEAAPVDSVPPEIPPSEPERPQAGYAEASSLAPQVSASTAPTVPPTHALSAHSDQRSVHSVSSTSSGQRKQARVIEAATATTTSNTTATATTTSNTTATATATSNTTATATLHPTAPHSSVYRNKHSKGFVALQAHLKTHLRAQQYAQQNPPVEDNVTEYDPVYNPPPGTSSGNSSNSSNNNSTLGSGKGVLVRLAPRVRGTGNTTSGSVSAIGLGSPVPTRRQELLTDLSQQYQSVMAAGASRATKQSTSLATTTSTSTYTNVNTSTSTSTSTGMSSVTMPAVPGSHSTLRLLLRAENEQRRKTLPQTLPRFCSATSAHLAQLELQQQQQQQGDR